MRLRFARTHLVNTDTAHWPNEEQSERPKNGDGFVNWLTTHPADALGHVPVTHWSSRIVLHDGHGICRVDVAAAAGPVRAKTGKAGDVFFDCMIIATRTFPEHGASSYLDIRGPGPPDQ